VAHRVFYFFSFFLSFFNSFFQDFSFDTKMLGDELQERDNWIKTLENLNLGFHTQEKRVWKSFFS